MSAAYGDIERLLARARRRRARVVLATAGAAGLAIALAVLLSGAGALHLGIRPGVARALALGLAALALLGATGWSLLALRRSAWSAEAIARTVAGADGALRSDLVSAVELSRERTALEGSGAISVALLDAHVSRTAEAVRSFDLGAAIPDRPARRAGAALAGVALLHLLTFLAGGGALLAAYGRVLAGEPVAVAGPSLDPVTGDIELTYRYPAYLKREPRTVSGTGGEIRAPKGTEVAIRTRADRQVERAEVEVALNAGAEQPAAPTPAPRPPPGAHPTASSTPIPTPNAASAPPPPAAPPAAPAKPAAPALQQIALAISGGRDLSGTLLVGDGATYRFRFQSAAGRTVAEGPAIPIVVEPDAFPSVRITAPAQELEVKQDAVVRVDWTAEDDNGLDGLTLVTRTPGGAERRRPLRTLTGVRRDAGSFELPVAAERLGEGERLLYWLEVLDDDAVSGPKKGASATQVLKLYSEAEHRRLAMEKARAAWEALVGALGDRLELLADGPVATPTRLPLAAAQDAKVRAVHVQLRQVAAELRKDKAAPRELAPALENVAGAVRTAEQRTTSMHQAIQRMLARVPVVDEAAAMQSALYDRLLDEELEKGVLYLEKLFDKARAEDLVRMAKDLANQRRDLARALEKVRDAPTEQAKAEAIAQLKRMKERMRELMARMAETARGFHDEHMNQEALAELGKQKDLMGELDAAEEALQRGDVAAAMKALEQMGGQLDQMMAGLQQTAGMPDASQAELMKEMLAFKDQLQQVQAEQQRLAGETEQIRADLKKRMAAERERAKDQVQKLEKLAGEARQALQQAQPGLPDRAEQDFETARDALSDLQRALSVKDLEAAQEMAQRAQAPAQRMAMTAEEDAAMAERVPDSTRKDPLTLKQAQARSREVAQKVAEVGRELQKLQPDPRKAMTPAEHGKLDKLSKEQLQAERKAAELQQKLSQLMQKAPVFPQSAPQQLGEARGHMGQAANDLSQQNPQRGRGEQQAALDGLERFRQGLEQMAKKSGQQGGGAFPFPFGEQGGAGEREGDGQEPSPEKVEIPGAEAHKAPDAFRRDLMEAMKQGAPERYRGEVQRYYEELVK